MVTEFLAGETYKNLKTGQIITVFAILNSTNASVLMAGVEVDPEDMSTSKPQRILIENSDLANWEELSLE